MKDEVHIRNKVAFPVFEYSEANDEINLLNTSQMQTSEDM